MFLLVQPQGQGSRLLPRAAGVARAPAGAEERGSAGRGDGGARAPARDFPTSAERLYVRLDKIVGTRHDELAGDCEAVCPLSGDETESS